MKRLLTWVLAVGLGVGGVSLLSIHTMLTHGWYGAYRYSGPGGIVMGAIDTLFAFGAGASLGASLAKWMTTRKGDQSRWPWFVPVIALIVLAYLGTVANFGR